MKLISSIDLKLHIVLLLVLTAAGCSRSLARFETLISDGEYQKAAALAGRDPESSRQLATALVVRAIENGKDINANIDILRDSAGHLGKRALKKLCRTAPSPASDHACMARLCRSWPRQSTWESYLTSDDSEVRARAARKWAHKLDKKELMALLGDIDPGVRTVAVNALGGFHPDTEVADALQNTLGKDPVASVRSAAAKTGPALGQDAVLSLKTALGDENMGVRLAVLQGLARLEQPSARDVLRNIANGPIDEMAVVAIVELMRLREEGLAARLEKAGQSPRLVIRQATLLRLERANAKNRQKLLEKALEDPSPSVILLAARLLSRLENGEAPARAALQKIMGGDSPEAAPARNLLATLGDADAVKKTRERLQKGEETERLSILAEAYRAPGLTATFAELMGHNKETIRLAAARACLRSKNTE